ncbi:MAG: LptF/LptG family permease, partial [Thermodesulfobacteriota bacterium]|nr:LptF/LptG family permease [Thermodesulfobacteriota bacterium]
MKIIDRYILLIFIKVFCLSMSGIIVLYMVIDMLEKLDDLLPFHPAFVAVMKYFILKIPLIITQTIPVAILISTVISLGMLARNYEIVAMQASGIGLIRIFAPILILTLLITVVVFFLNEMIVPYANEKVKYVRVVEIEGKKPVTLFKKDK